MKLTCSFCSVEFDKKDWLYRHAVKSGRTKFFCSNACVGKAKKRDEVEKRSDWLEYLKRYHQEHLEHRHAQSRKKHRDNYDPDKRKESYLRVADKERRQGRKRYAQREYGSLWESALLISDIRKQVSEIATREQVRAEKGYFERKHERKKSYERSNRKELEVGTLGNLERRERR